jgi:hypothetical protein
MPFGSNAVRGGLHMKWISLAVGVAMVATSSVVPQTAMAWGEFGHLTVCELAYRNLTPTARAAVKDLLQVESGGIAVRGRDGVEDRRYTSFNVGCLEEDERPRKHPKDHFINLDRAVSRIEDNTCPVSETTGEPLKCILSGIERDLAILKDSSKPSEERAFALMAVGHWIGDIHQPLHVSFADDSGGNGVAVRLAGKCGTSTYRPRNLHAVWDNCLLEAGLFEKVRQRADFKKTWGRRTITYRAVDTLQANTSLAAEQAFVTTVPWQWANESLAVTLRDDVRYCFKVGNDCQYSSTVRVKPEGSPDRKQDIDQAYLVTFKGTAEERVQKAGFRLAHLINRALDPAYTAPVN